MLASIGWDLFEVWNRVLLTVELQVEKDLKKSWDFLLHHLVHNNIIIFHHKKHTNQTESQEICVMMMIMMMMMMMIINCFCGITDRRKEFSLIPSRDHCQGSSPSRISDTPPTGFECVQKLISDLVEWGYAAVIATIPQRHYFGNFKCDSMQNKSITTFVPTAVINSK